MLRFFTGSDFRDSSRPSRQSSFLRALLLSFLPPSCCAHMLRPPASISCLHLPHKIKLGTALGRSPAHFFCAGCISCLLPLASSVPSSSHSHCSHSHLSFRRCSSTFFSLSATAPRPLSGKIFPKVSSALPAGPLHPQGCRVPAFQH